MYLYNANQGAIDPDSSVVLACKAYKLPLSLAYDEGFNEGKYLIGNDLINKGNINSVQKLLAKSKMKTALDYCFNWEIIICFNLAQNQMISKMPKFISMKPYYFPIS